MKPTIAIHNAETGEITTREMTDKEAKLYEAEKAAFLAETEAILAKQAEQEAARQSAREKLAALGLTEAEIQALAGQCEH